MSQALQKVLGFSALAAVIILGYSAFVSNNRYELRTDRLPNNHFFVFDSATGCIFGQMRFEKKGAKNNLASQPEQDWEWKAYNRCPIDFEYQEEIQKAEEELKKQ